MPKFKFTMTRDTTESVSVTVEAPSIEEAHEEALANPPQAGWEQDENYPQRPYLPDEDDWEVVN
tara:strand:+ start:1525 stop:1716 length:192 start_codon:yes stop_codon:yes gene_type:complete